MSSRRNKSGHDDATIASTTTDSNSSSVTNEATAPPNAESSSAGETSVVVPSQIDPSVAKYLPFIGDVLQSQLNVIHDIDKGQFRWASGQKKFGFGELLLNRRLNTPAMFTLVGQILPDAMDMEPVPGWSEDNPEKFRNAKYRFCVGPVHTSESLTSHFNVVVSFLQKFIEKKSSLKSKFINSLFLIEDANSVLGIKFGYKFFCFKESKDTVYIDEIRSVYIFNHYIRSNSPSETSYPWTYENAKSYYNENLKTSFTPVAFPAKDKNGHIISPTSLPEIIENATVSVTFKLHYYRIADKIIYNADVDSLTVLDV